MRDSVLCPRADQPRRKLEIGEIQVELYRRECRKLNVTPVGAFIRSPSSPVLNIRHYSLGPGGALALSVPLTVSSEICDIPTPPPTPTSSLTASSEICDTTTPPPHPPLVSR